jgi:hypothetical protein
MELLPSFGLVLIQASDPRPVPVSTDQALGHLSFQPPMGVEINRTFELKAFASAVVKLLVRK